jgi:hypothetical protein
MATNTLTYAELSTILAALRTFLSVRRGDEDCFWPPDTEPMTDAQITSLCVRLNCGEIVRIVGGPRCGED